MKIKTITCHEVYNYGATLQEFALLKYLEKEGHDAEVIHYKPPYLSGHFNLTSVSSPRFDKPVLKQLYILAKLPGRILDLKRKKSFDLFSKKHIPTGKVEYNTNKELKVNTPEADAYICGSDQIWNSFFENGKDPSFYLDFVPDHKLKISYAASFAIDKVSDELKSFVKEKVSRLNAVSVRELSGKEILTDLGITNVTQVMDPVFLLDANYWVKNFVKPIKEKFIFVYDCDSNKVIKEIVEEAANKYCLKIYTVNKNIKYATKNFYNKGPEVFLSLIHEADFIISNSFHAVAFSLIFSKTFFVVDRNENINTRMKDIMSQVGLAHLHLAVGEFKSFNGDVIDYESVNKVIIKKSLESKLFLKKAIH